MSALISAAFVILLAQGGASTDYRTKYHNKTGQCLNDMAPKYANDDDVSGQARLLAAECMSYSPPLLACPSLEGVLSPFELGECRKSDDELVAKITRITEDNAIQAMTLARMQR